MLDSIFLRQLGIVHFFRLDAHGLGCSLILIEMGHWYQLLQSLLVAFLHDFIVRVILITDTKRRSVAIDQV